MTCSWWWWGLALVPKNLLSRLFGFLSERQWPEPFRRILLNWFINRYKLDMTEAEFSLDHYPSLQKLFTRRLKPGLRPLAREGQAVHPCDGKLTVMGRLDHGHLIQAKGLDYRLEDLVVDKSLAQSLQGGGYATYYLCPTDYHRVHAPLEGVVDKIIYQPGTLWPVNEWSVQHVPRLFARNERLIFSLKGSTFPPDPVSALVMVGATNVGRMTTPLAPQLVTNMKPYSHGSTIQFSPPTPIQMGQEIGVFNLGSTVIFLWSKEWQGSPLTFLPSPQTVRWGGPLM